MRGAQIVVCSLVIVAACGERSVVTPVALTRTGKTASAEGPYCGEAQCVAVGGTFISHFKELGCTGAEAYYTPYDGGNGGVRRSWNGSGMAGTTIRTLTHKSWRGSDGECHDAWESGNTLGYFVTIYRQPPDPGPYYCGEAQCVAVGSAYISHYTEAGCAGAETYYTPYDGGNGGTRRSWNGKGWAGTILRTVTNKSWRGSDGQCHDSWLDGSTLSGFVAIYRDASSAPPTTPPLPPCGEAQCKAVTQAYISHYTGAGCTGTESYWTTYFNGDGIRRSFNGQGNAGTILRTVTNRSWRGSDGQCHDTWQSGNTLNNFVTIYR
jgi:hypothetical protein